jgi:putative nucleotide binding protein
MSLPDHYYQDNSKGNGFGSYHVNRKYEEYAHIIEFTIRGKSSTVKKKEGIIIQAVGEERLTLLELLGDPSKNFEIGDRVYIGREGRTKIISVLGRLNYNDLSASARNEISITIEKIVDIKEKRFVDYFNNAQAITPRVHGLELIPGIGKIYMKSIIAEREKKKFESFKDIQERVGVKDLQKLITKRIVEEISGETRMNLFVRK